MIPLEESLDVDKNTSFDDLPASQKPTQPLGDNESQESDDEDEEEDEIEDENCWGKLYPFQFGLPFFSLDQDEISVGRSNGCTVRISEQHVSKGFLESISKIHFVIKKTQDGIRIFDNSSNGTYIATDLDNFRPVKKKNTVGVLLEHKMIISIAKYKSFVFMRTGPTFKNKNAYPNVLRKGYIPSIKLGRGATGEVILAFRKTDKKGFAVKCLDKMKSKDTFKRILEEGNVLKNLDHRAIVKFEEQLESKDKFFIVLELAPGGELFDMIRNNNGIKEEQAKMYFYQMTSAIQYLHENKIIHRDLKPENMLMCASENEDLTNLVPTLKISDFGLCRIMEDNRGMASTFVGTPCYLAPEMLNPLLGKKREYDYKVDIWSLGVILYTVLSGKPAFYGENQRWNILQAKYDFAGGCDWDSMPLAKDLITKMLVIDPKRRLSANQVMKHPWLNDKEAIMKAKSLMGSRFTLPNELTVTMPANQVVDNSLKPPSKDSKNSNPIINLCINERLGTGQPEAIVSSPPRKKKKLVQLANGEIPL